MKIRDRAAYWLLALASWMLPEDHPALIDIHNAASEIATPTVPAGDA